MPAFRQRFGIGFTQGLKNRRALDHTVVQHDKLQLAVRPPLAGLGNKTLDANSIFLHRIQRQKPRHEIPAEQVPQPHAEIVCRRSLPEPASVARQRHSHPGMRHRQRLHLVNDMGRLGFFATQEFFSRGKIIEERLDLDRRARRGATFSDGFDFSPCHANLGSRVRFRRPCREAESGNTRNAGQRLATKTHRCHRRQILG